MGRQDEIQLIAYHIWEEEGCCDGRDCEHWLKAEVVWREKQKGKAFSTVPKAAPKLAMEQSKMNNPKTTHKG
jgi:hypothetical protein